MTAKDETPKTVKELMTSGTYDGPPVTVTPHAPIRLNLPGGGVQIIYDLPMMRHMQAMRYRVPVPDNAAAAAAAMDAAIEAQRQWEAKVAQGRWNEKFYHMMVEQHGPDTERTAAAAASSIQAASVAAQATVTKIPVVTVAAESAAGKLLAVTITPTTDTAAASVVAASSAKVKCATYRLCGTEVSTVTKEDEYKGHCLPCYRRQLREPWAAISNLGPAEEKNNPVCLACSSEFAAMKFNLCGHAFCVLCLQYVFPTVDRATNAFKLNQDHANFVAFRPGGRRCPECYAASSALVFGSLREMQDVAEIVTRHYSHSL